MTTSVILPWKPDGLGHRVPNYQSIQVGDPLWDGGVCGPTSTCCYDPQRKVNPP